MGMVPPTVGTLLPLHATDLPTGQPYPENPSLRISSQVVLDCQADKTASATWGESLGAPLVAPWPPLSLDL